MTEKEPDDQTPGPRVQNLTSGLGYVDPERYRSHAYPPHWGYTR